MVLYCVTHPSSFSFFFVISFNSLHIIYRNILMYASYLKRIFYIFKQKESLSVTLLLRTSTTSNYSKAKKDKSIQFKLPSWISVVHVIGVPAKKKNMEYSCPFLCHTGHYDWFNKDMSRIGPFTSASDSAHTATVTALSVRCREITHIYISKTFFFSFSVPLTALYCLSVTRQQHPPIFFRFSWKKNASKPMAPCKIWSNFVLKKQFDFYKNFTRKRAVSILEPAWKCSFLVKTGWFLSVL